MANLNYMGSLAQARMRFRSTTDVVVDNVNELFHAITIYVPKRFAAANIVGWDETQPWAQVTAERPALIAVTVDNYTSWITGDLADQWFPIWRQDTNSSVILYLVIFDDTQTQLWNIQDKSIEYAPLTTAFTALFAFSYFKFLYDPDHSGKPVPIAGAPGLRSSMQVVLGNYSTDGAFARQTLRFVNSGVRMQDGTLIQDPAAKQLPAGAAYQFNNGSKLWQLNIPQLVTLNAPAPVSAGMTATTNGPDSAMVNGLRVTSYIQPVISMGIEAFLTNVVQGTNDPAPTALALVDQNEGPDANLTEGLDITAMLTPALPTGITATAINVVQAGTPTDPTTADIKLVNTTSAAITIPSDTYVLATDGSRAYDITISNDLVIQPQGTPTTADITFVNTVMSTQLIPAGSYIVNNGATNALDYGFTFAAQQSLSPGQTYDQNIQAATIGIDNSLALGAEMTGLFIGTQTPPQGVRAFTQSLTNGSNPGVGQPITILSGTYLYSSPGGFSYAISVPTDTVLQPSAVTQTTTLTANAVGADTSLSTGPLDGTLIQPGLPPGVRVVVLSVTLGRPDVQANSVAPSMYFDLSLALAQLCRNNIQLSWFWTLVRINFVNKQPDIQDPCWIIYRRRAEQLSAMQSLIANDRARYYWAALYLLQCQNTCVCVHSEPDNIIVDVFAAWFAQRNSSGTFIGNKLSLLHLSGTRIKPMGWPSWIDESINENAVTLLDDTGMQYNVQDELRDMNVGHLITIADNTPQDSYLSMAHGVGTPGAGLPVNMQAIAKFCDYTMAQESAKWITADGTLTDVISADADAYAEIQKMVVGVLHRFAGDGDGRLYGIRLTFPSFAVARKSRTMLSAATSWAAFYRDALDTIEVSGGIIAQ